MTLVTSSQGLSSQQTSQNALSVGILAPRGRDAAVAVDLLGKNGVPTVILSSIEALAQAVRDEIGAILITEEAISVGDLTPLQAALAAQPPWSDLPFIVLANGAVRMRTDRAKDRIALLNNATLLSRPLHAEELIRSVRSALTARRRQHEARRQLEELHLRERQLGESEAKFHAIADSVNQMIWSTRPDGYHDYYNLRWYEFTGMEEGTTDGEAWNGMFHEDDQEHAWAVWRESLRTGDDYEIEYRLRHHSGEYRWVLGRAQPVHGPDGSIVRWYGTCTDIHDEVLSREATVNDLTRQRDVVWNTAIDLIAIVDSAGNFTMVNDAWHNILGWKADELVGMHILALAHPDDKDTSLEIFSKIFEKPLSDPYESRTRCCDGSYRWISWTASHHDGEIYALGRDVTDRIAEAKRLQMTEAALRQSQKLEMIGQLTGGVAHDFNNLLMATRSSLDLLRRHLPDADTRTLSLIDNATKATDRGAALTQRMLAFARKQDLHAVTVDISTAIPELRDLMTRTIGPQIEVKIDIAPDTPCANIDLNQLEMAMLNLAVNGRDAMDGKGKLILTAAASDGAGIPDLPVGQYVRIDVTDSGAGMDAGTLAQATEPFFTTKGVGKGTGLGLSMIHGFAKQSGGTFTLASVVGVGTTATLYLPAAQDVADSATAEPPEAEAATDAPRRRVILAVDDDILVAMGTVGILEDLGHDVIAAYSGVEALAAIQSRPDIELVITDQAMPKMTGIELARQIRQTHADIPIILATGYAEMPEGGKAFITDRLEKPFSDRDLEKMLARHP